MLKIYLADLANELYEIDNKSVPIGVGFAGIRGPVLIKAKASVEFPSA